MVAQEDPLFKFLKDEEYSALTREQRVEYLNKALESLQRTMQLHRKAVVPKPKTDE